MSAPRPFAEIVDELTRLDAAATPGPWDLSMNENGDIMGVECTRYSDETPGVCGNHSKHWPILNEDADLIATTRNALPAILSRLASREAVFEAAVGWARRTKDEAHYDNAQEERLRAAIEAARALDAATPQGEETK